MKVAVGIKYTSTRRLVGPYAIGYYSGLGCRRMTGVELIDGGSTVGGKLVGILGVAGIVGMNGNNHFEIVGTLDIRK